MLGRVARVRAGLHAVHVRGREQVLHEQPRCRGAQAAAPVLLEQRHPDVQGQARERWSVRRGVPAHPADEHPVLALREPLRTSDPRRTAGVGVRGNPQRCCPGGGEPGGSPRPEPGGNILRLVGEDLGVGQAGVCSRPRCAGRGSQVCPGCGAGARWRGRSPATAAGPGRSGPGPGGRWTVEGCTPRCLPMRAGPHRRLTQSPMVRRSRRCGVRPGLWCAREDRSSMPASPGLAVAHRPAGRGGG